MEPRAQAVWVILLTFAAAYLLAIVPFPEWAMNYRPQWVVMVLIFWAITLPYRVGIGSAWVAGLLLDVLDGSMLGLNALAFSIVAYMAISLHQRLRMFSSVQQSGLVLAMVGLHMMIVHWLKIATAQTVSTNLFFLLGALSSAFLWPWLYFFMRRLRLGFDVR